MTRNPVLFRSQAETEPALDQKQIVQAALSLLDEVGLDNLSMRRLAEKLDIKAASLYWHVRDKDHLLGLMADAICALLHEPDPALPWRSQLETLAQENRRVLWVYRDGARVLASTIPSGATRLRLIDLVLGTLLKAGFGPSHAVYAGFLLNDYVTTFVIEEARFIDPRREQNVDPEARRAALHQWLDDLPPGEYPNLHQLAERLVEDNADARFRFGLEIILDGLENHLAKTNRNS